MKYSINIYSLSNELVDVASFVINRYMVYESDIIEAIIIDVEEVEDSLFGYTQLDGTFAWIFLSDKLNHEELITTCIHETIHAIQMALGDLKYIGNRSFWKGDEIEVDYDKEPWEVEAYGMEKIIYEEYLNEHQ